MDPEALRFAADCWDRKADKLMFLDGHMKEAERAIDMAIDLRVRANFIEDQQRKANHAKARVRP